jgi:large subunit ribosomal protein L9
MKLILLQDVKGLGKKDEIVNVADGYARNYLIPKKMAREATEGSIKQIQQEKKALQKRKSKEREEAMELAAKLSKSSTVIKVKAGEQGKLFGSITSKDIAEALNTQYGLKVDKRKIELSEPIKSLGNYEVGVKLAANVDAKITVKIVEG